MTEEGQGPNIEDMLETGTRPRRPKRVRTWGPPWTCTAVRRR